MKRMFMLAALFTLLGSRAALAEAPAEARHPNLRQAHADLEKAIESIGKAQVANKFQLKGHAAKAKALIEQAKKEIEAAAVAADQAKALEQK